jgi:hypothetical protein
VIDKWIYKFLDWLDSWTSWIDDMFIKHGKKCKCYICNPAKDEHDPEFLDGIDEDK